MTTPDRAPEPLRKHVFHASRWRNHRGESICECGSLRGDKIHDVPETPAEAKAIDERRVGE